MRQQLHPREKLIIGMGLAALAAMLFVYWLLFPLMDRRERSERQAITREKELREMIAYQDEYKQRQRESRRLAIMIAQRPTNFSLFSFLDQLAGTSGIKTKIVYMKPSNVTNTEKNFNLSRVEIKLKEVTLDQISRFLYHIETSPHLINVPRLSIKQEKQESGYLEAVLQVETLET